MFEDEAVFQQGGTKVRTWAMVGIGYEVKTEPCKRSVKVFGAVTVEDMPKWHFRFVPGFNAETFLTFLQQLIRHAGSKVFLILDNARYHYANAIHPWLKDHRHRIRLFFLPPYAPQLNPVEPIWKKSKAQATHNRHFQTLDSLHHALFRRFNRFQGNPSSLSTTLAPWL